MKLSFLTGLAAAATLAVAAQALDRGDAATPTDCCATALAPEAQEESAPEAQTDADAERAAVIAAQLPSYPLETCPVSGLQLDSKGEPVDVVVDGRLIRLCCAGCKGAVKKDASEAIAQIEAGVKAQEAAHYPLEVCPVSGKELGSMGDPLEVVVGTRLVRLCCAGCRPKLEADPSKSLAKIDAAYVEQQLEHYPLTTCPVSGEPLPADAENVLYGTTLVRFCCKSCPKSFREDPQPVLEELHAAYAAQAEHGDSGGGDDGDDGHGGHHGNG